MRTGRPAHHIAVAAATLALTTACTANGTPAVTSARSTGPTSVPVGALATKVRNLGKLTLSTGSYSVIVDLQQNRALIPDFIYGSHMDLVAYGTVDAVDDLSAISSAAFTVSPDGTSVTVTVPAIALGTPNIDTNSSELYDTQSGLFNHIGAVISSGSDASLEMVKLAQQKITATATASGLPQTAQNNLTAVLDALLKDSGFTTVVVQFASA